MKEDLIEVVCVADAAAAVVPQLPEAALRALCSGGARQALPSANRAYGGAARLMRGCWQRINARRHRRGWFDDAS